MNKMENKLDISDLDSIRTEQLERDTEKALRIQKQMRKDAPRNVRVGAQYVDPRETLVRRLVPAAFWSGKPTSDKGQGRKGSVPPEMSTFFDRAERHKENIAKGYVPVIDEGEHAQHAGDLLYKRPIEFQKREIERASLASRERLMVMDEQAKADGLVENETKNEFAITDGNSDAVQ